MPVSWIGCMNDLRAGGPITGGVTGTAADLTRGTLAAAPIGLRWAGLRGQPDRRQAYEPPPLVKSAARFRLLRMSLAVLENLGT
jgi:hypothetical protein